MPPKATTDEEAVRTPDPDDPFDDGSQEYKDLLDELDAPQPEGWQPEPGDKLVGKIVQISSSNAGGYGEYPLLTIETGPGERVALHCFHTALKNEVTRLNPREGDRLAVKFEGKVQQKKGELVYESYRVILQRAPENR